MYLGAKQTRTAYDWQLVWSTPHTPHTHTHTHTKSHTIGEPITRSLNCWLTPAAQLAHITGCWASAMLSRRMSRCRLPSGKRQPAHEAKHHGPPAVQPRPFCKPPQNDVGRDAPAELTEIAQEGHLETCSHHHSRVFCSTRALAVVRRSITSRCREHKGLCPHD